MNCTNDNGPAFPKHVDNTCLSLFTFFPASCFALHHWGQHMASATIYPSVSSLYSIIGFEHLSVYPCTSAYLLTCLISGDSYVLFQAVIPSMSVSLYLCKQCRSRLVLEKAQGMTPVVIYLFILLFT